MTKKWVDEILTAIEGELHEKYDGLVILRDPEILVVTFSCNEAYIRVLDTSVHVSNYCEHGGRFFSLYDAKWWDKFIDHIELIWYLTND